MECYLFSKITQILGAGKNSRYCEILALEQNFGCWEMKFWVLGNEILGAERISGLGVGNSGRWEILGAQNFSSGQNFPSAQNFPAPRI